MSTNNLHSNKTVVFGYGKFHSILTARAYLSQESLDCFYTNIVGGSPRELWKFRKGSTFSFLLRKIFSRVGLNNFGNYLYEDILYKKFVKEALDLLDSSSTTSRIHCFSMYGYELSSRFDNTSLDFASLHFNAQDEIKARLNEEFGLARRPISPKIKDRADSEFEVCSRILVASQLSANSFPHKFKSKIEVVPIGGLGDEIINESYFDRPRKLQRKTFEIGFFGGAAGEKGLILLLRGLEKTIFPNKVRIFGAGVPASYRVYEHFFSRCMNSDFKIEGPISSKKGMVKAFGEVDCVVVPSPMEGFGMLAVESALAGRPTLISKYVGAVEMLSGLPNVWVYDPWSAEEFDEKITLIMEQFLSNAMISTNVTAPHYRISNSLSIEEYGKKLCGAFR